MSAVQDRPAARLSLVTLGFLLVFFVSGFTALLYQIIWQRVLTLFGGADVHSVTIIVASYMAGLGFGSLAGGYLADRLTTRSRLMAFAGCELAIALFAAFSANIYYDFLYGWLGSWPLARSAMAAIIFAVTLWPTAFMGMSLPLLATALTHDARQPARWVPILYGVNTVGAGCGSLFAATILFRAFDFATSLRIGALLSLGCALAAFVCAPYVVRRWTNSQETSTLSQRPLTVNDAEHSPQSIRLPAWVAIYALSGFVALSLEIVWFRVLGVMLKSNSFTFGHLLGLYLLGVGFGSLIGEGARARARPPATTFFILQAAIPIVAALGLLLVLVSLDRVPGTEPLWRYLGQYQTLTREDILRPAATASESSRWGLIVTLYAVLPLLLLGFPTVMMGLSFGYLQRAVQRDLNRLGRRVGWLQAANIVGAMAGALATGLLLLDRLGTSGTLRLIVCSSIVFLFFAAHIRRDYWRVSAGAMLGVCVIAYVIPSASLLWARLHGAVPRQIIHGEDGSGVSVLKLVLEGQQTVVYANGLGQSTLPYGGLHSVLGALPAMIHPDPRTVAVIGLGSGDTLVALGGRSGIQAIDSIEIVAPQLDTLKQLERVRPYPGLRSLLHDSRVRHWFTDGRTFIRHADRRYDIIEADAVRPTSAHAGNLYSVEYFELLRDRLNPGGIAVTWTPTDRVVASFVKVFTHVLVFEGLAVGSSTPVIFDRLAVQARMQEHFTRDYYTAAQIDLHGLLQPYLARDPQVVGPDFDRRLLVDLNRDLFPKDEFAAATTDH